MNILPLCVPLKRHQTTEVCCAVYCSNRTCACSTTNDDFGPGETLLCLEAKTSQECHQQHTLLDKKIILVGNIHTNILFCKDFLDYQPKIWADAEQQEPPTLGGAFLLGFLESGKIKCIFDEEVVHIVVYYSYSCTILCCYPILRLLLGILFLVP